MGRDAQTNSDQEEEGEGIQQGQGRLGVSWVMPENVNQEKQFGLSEEAY